jgi:methylthioribose-1-phosphate isomerase
MVVRGAPAIGIAAAYGLALAALRGDDLAEAERVLASSRPTAVNLPWALAQMREEPTPGRARALHARRGRALPEDGRPRRRALPAGHARAHALQRRAGSPPAATARRSALSGRRRSAVSSSGSSSTRPGRFSREPASPPGSSSAAASRTRSSPTPRPARSWRAARSTSSSPAPTGSRERGHGEQDRDILARRARCAPRIPFYVVAPTSTLDRETSDGSGIPIEERDPAELTTRFPARNPAFDVTPAALIAAIVTEDGVHRAPYEESLA